MRLDLIDKGAGERAETYKVEEAEGAGRWEWRKRTTTNVHCTVRGEDDYDKYPRPTQSLMQQQQSFPIQSWRYRS